MTVPVDPSPKVPASAERTSRRGLVLVVLAYVLPLGTAVILLLLLGDKLIGIALLVVELLTITGIRLALRAPQPAQRRDRLPGEPILGLPGERGSTNTARSFAGVALGMIGVVLVIAAVAVIASHAG